MIRRRLLFTALALAAAPVLAHHGWSSFDQDKPLYLAGTVKSVRWQNPHAEFVLTVPPSLAVPADLAARKAPAQSQSIDGSGIFKRAAVPANAAGDWEIELAPLSRMNAGRDFLTEPKPAIVSNSSATRWPAATSACSASRRLMSGKIRGAPFKPSVVAQLLGRLVRSIGAISGSRNAIGFTAD
jgi:hypothetical protein